MKRSGADSAAALKAEPEALGDYFGSLLDEPDATTPLLREDILEPAPAETASIEPPALPGTGPAEPEPETEAPAERIYSRPDKAFSVLVIEAGNLALLAPLHALGGVAPLDSLEVRPTPNHSPWYLGLAASRQGWIQLIDLAAVVTPEDRDYEPDTARHVVFLAESRFALACNAICGTRVLDPEALRWRSQRRRLPWLAAIERENMATLLDLEELDRTLDAGAWDQ